MGLHFGGTSIHCEFIIEFLNGEFWYQQDGVPCNCSNECLNLLREKLPNRLICRRTENALPGHSPDLSPLDCWFWVTMERIMYLRHSKTSKL